MFNLSSLSLRFSIHVLLSFAFLTAACSSPATTDGNSDANSADSSGDSSAATAPSVSAETPTAGATGVALNTKIFATFSEAMDPLSIDGSTFVLKNGATAIAGTVTAGPDDRTATFTPASNLPAGVTLTASLTVGVKSATGHALAADFTWTFVTGSEVDQAAPGVSGSNPVNNATGTPINVKIAATFSEAMDPASITAATFTLARGTEAIAGSVAYGTVGTTAIFTPAVSLPSNATITATITTSAKDLAGNALAAPYVWTFTTGSTVAKGPATVYLGTAGHFAILSKTGISTVPGSHVTGDIGVSPAAATYLTGFSLKADPSNVFATSTQVVGKVYAADYAVPTPANLTTAISNLEGAYTDAAGRPTPDFLELGSGNIGGLTLAPGLYKWTSSITIPTNLTISGGADDVWIFQTTGDLALTAAKQVILAGGAQAKNIFWNIAGHATFGADSHFEGIVLCKTDATLETGASMNGRMLVQTQVALQKATFTEPVQ